MAWAIITGASSGIGSCLAREIAGDGYDVVLVARREARLEIVAKKIREECGVQTRVMGCDLSEDGAGQKVFDACMDLEVEMLVNNAGLGWFGEFSQANAVRDSAMVHVNVLALTDLTRLFLPKMVERKRGFVMQVASVAGFVPGPLMSVYYATKAYVLSFTGGLARELKGTGVKVSALCPGPTESEFGNVAGYGDVAFKGILPSSQAVARFGFISLKKGRVIAVYGFNNQILVWLSRIMPQWIIRHIVYRINR